MSRLYLLLLAVIAGAVLLGMAIAEHPGYVLFAYKGYRFESSLWVFFGLLMVLAGLVGREWLFFTVFGLFFASIVFLVIYSYIVWKSDPDRVNGLKT